MGPAQASIKDVDQPDFGALDVTGRRPGSPRSAVWGHPSGAVRAALQVLRALPAAAYAVVALAPVGILVAYSVFRDEAFRFQPAFDLSNFSAAISGAGDLAVLLKTLTVMWIAAISAVVIAYSVVFAVVVLAPRLLKPIMAAALLALFGGYLVRIFAWRILLGRYGILASIAGRSGLFARIGNLADTRWAVLLALVNFSVPLCMLPISASFNALGGDILAASYDLGAGTLGTLRRVVLPVTMKGIAFAFAIAFVLCAGDYVTPTLLGGVDGFMFGNLITQQFTLTSDWPLGGALAVVLMVSVVAVIALMSCVFRGCGAVLSGATLRRKSFVRSQVSVEE